jgi:hypothetical protein
MDLTKEPVSQVGGGRDFPGFHNTYWYECAILGPASVFGPKDMDVVFEIKHLLPPIFYNHCYFSQSTLLFIDTLSRS